MCRDSFKHIQVSLGNDDSTGWPADFMVFDGANRDWGYDPEVNGNFGHNQVFLNIGEVYHAWVMVQVSLCCSSCSCSCCCAVTQIAFQQSKMLPLSLLGLCRMC